jgi:hypothetical protein
MLERQSPWFTTDRGKHDCRLDVALSKKYRLATGIRNPCQYAHSSLEVNAQVQEGNGVEPGCTKENASHWPEWNQDRDAGNNRPGLHQLLPASSTELIPVTPGGELRTERLSNTNELDSFAQSCQANLIGGSAKLGAAVCALTFFDCFPPLLDWREVPSLTLTADDPQPALRRVECETTADRKMLYGLVSAEIRLAEETGRIHLPIPISRRV